MKVFFGRNTGIDSSRMSRHPKKQRFSRILLLDKYKLYFMYEGVVENNSGLNIAVFFGVPQLYNSNKF